MRENELAREIVDAALTVHRVLGAGLLESVYEAALAHELRKRGLSVQTQVVLPVVYDGVDLGLGLRVDILVENLVLVEVKSVEKILPLFRKQALSYLKLGGWRLGLLINFNVELIKEGITRIANGLPEELQPLRPLRPLRELSSSHDHRD